MLQQPTYGTDNSECYSNLRRGEKSESVEGRPLPIPGRRWHNNNTNSYNYTNLCHLSRFSTSTADEFRSSKNHH